MGFFVAQVVFSLMLITPEPEIERKNEFKETRVKFGTTIGANATIVCGNTLGEYSLPLVLLWQMMCHRLPLW